MTTGPDHDAADHQVAMDRHAATARGHLRAGHHDREQAITVLKAAFVQGRLTQDELEARAAEAYAAKTYADLALLTADLPAPADLLALTADLPAPAAHPAVPGPKPASTPARTLGKAARRAGVCLLTAVALTEAAFLTQNGFLLVLAFFAFMAASGFIGYGVIDARQERRSRAQLPPRPDHHDHRFHDGRPSRAPWSSRAF